ncbi:MULTISPECIES: PmeII family type II restriction endonuclease [unclassified Clostridium]|uniref:PmeII family type II restriction endonuclease n=1 Tax=unclassified Clostridium TaxID=2614128 RepID=UPI001105F4BC|nr:MULTISPECIES: PmeII family type II restriction endonuclease [unclassified Clostridium]
MLNLEPLNESYDQDAVIEAVSTALTNFYDALTKTLDKIDVDKILKRKNPYLYRAKGINNVKQIVDGILAAYISSSEETVFGNCFFEPIAIVVSGGQKAVTEGVDITVDKDNTIYSIAVKSGTSVFNADSRKRQEQNFQSAQKRAQQARKAYLPVVGYGYGKKKTKAGKEKFYLELAGKDFWEWLTGDATFYQKIIDFMGTRPDEYVKKFEEAYNRAENRMMRDFTVRYCREDGSIDWNTLVQLNSGE